MLSFSTTPPHEIIGTFYHDDDHDIDQLRSWADQKGISFLPTHTKKDLQDMLNNAEAREQGWTPNDRIIQCCILKLWHWITTVLMFGPGPGQFILFKDAMRHLEPALRVFTDLIAKCHGSRKVTPQLLTVRDNIVRTGLEALARGETFCDFCLQACEDSHRERKSRANTKCLRSLDGVDVKMTDEKSDCKKGVKRLPPAKNTPVSTNQYHRRQCSGCHHAFKQRERTPTKNSWSVYSRKRLNPNPFVKVKQEQPKPSASVDTVDVSSVSTTGPDELNSVTASVDTGDVSTASTTGPNGVEASVDAGDVPWSVEFVDTSDVDWWSELICRTGVLEERTKRFDKVEINQSTVRTYVPGDPDGGIIIAQPAPNHKVNSDINMHVCVCDAFMCGV